MVIAIFGRTIQRESLGELSLFVNELKSVDALELIVYEPFFNVIKEIASNEPMGSSIIDFFSKFPLFTSHLDLPEKVDLFFSLGGDGTFLSSLPFIRGKSIPIAGLNFGRLGFLTSSKIGKSEGNYEWFSNLLKGKFSLQSRPLLKLEYPDTPEDFYPFALNEFAIQREGPAVLELNIKINGIQVPKYVADGVLISTATGSTAYSLSAGGPIIMPECSVMSLVPIAPHNLNIRPLVLSGDSIVDVSFTTRYDYASITADNRSFKIPNGANMRILRSEVGLNVVAPDINFMKALSTKLFWGADWHNL